MLLLILMTIFNSVANQQSVINVLRFEFGGIALGVNELMALVVFAYALIFGGSIARVYPNRAVPKYFAITIAITVLSLIIGSIVSFTEQVDLGIFLRSARELGTWPVFIIVGYRVLGTPRAVMAFIYTVLLAGLLTALVLLTHFEANME